MYKSILHFFLILLFICCGNISEKENIPDLPTFNIENDGYYSPYCVYLLEDKNVLSQRDLEDVISQYLPTHVRLDSFSVDTFKNEYVIDVFSDPVKDFPAPDLEYLQHAGHSLSEQEMLKLQAPFKAISITFTGRKETAVADQININKVFNALLIKQDNVVMDYTTYESFNQQSWKQDRVSSFTLSDQDVASQITIHLYREDQFCRAITLGMGKFCLPDISIQAISCNDQFSYASLINLIAQTWIENPTLRIDSSLVLEIDKIKNDSARVGFENNLEEGAKKLALIQMATAEIQEGDAFNAQFEVVFKNNSFSSLQEEQTHLISKLFGSKDEIVYINHDDRILKASKKAKERIPELKEMFGKGLEPGYSILVKNPFETDEGGTEWMWVEVAEWTDQSSKGILQNQPFNISDIAAGAIVDFNSEDIFDYILYLPDGTYEGNETRKIISESQ